MIAMRVAAISQHIHTKEKWTAEDRDFISWMISENDEGENGENGR